MTNLSRAQWNSIKYELIKNKQKTNNPNSQPEFELKSEIPKKIDEPESKNPPICEG